MSRAEIDDTSATEEATDAARHFPRLVQLLAGQAAGAADGAGDTVEQCVAGETIEIAIGEACARRGRKGQPPSAHVAIVLTSSSVRRASGWSGR